jgi:hypothetical protein
MGFKLLFLFLCGLPGALTAAHSVAGASWGQACIEARARDVFYKNLTPFAFALFLGPVGRFRRRRSAGCRADLCAGWRTRVVYKRGVGDKWNGTTLAFWLRSSVVSVLSSLTTRTSPLDSSLVNIFLSSFARRPLLARLRDSWPSRCTIGLR